MKLSQQHKKHVSKRDNNVTPSEAFRSRNNNEHCVYHLAIEAGEFS